MTSPRYIRPISERFIIEQLSDGSVAVFDRAGDAVHSLNPAAAAVWTCCTEPSTIEDVRDALAGTTSPLGVGAIDAAVRQLLEAGLIQEGAGARPVSTPSSRRQVLKRIVGGAAAALPVVLTLAGKEQRLLAQGSGSPTVNLTGCWDLQDGDGTVLNLTQSGNTITGTITGAEENVSGKVTGTLSGTTLDATIDATIGGPTSSFRGTVHSTNVTDNAFSGTVIIQFAETGCDFGGGDNFNGVRSEDPFSAVRGCPPA